MTGAAGTPSAVSCVICSSAICHFGRNATVSVHGRQHRLAGDAQDGAVVPGGVGDEVMHRLMAGAHVAGINAGGHRFDALPFPRQTEPGDIVPKRTMPVLVPEGGGETFNIRVKPLGAGAREVGHTPRVSAYPMNSLTLL